jgi:hypothetical protein
MLRDDREERVPEEKQKKKISFSDGLDITVIVLVLGLVIAVILAFLAEFVIGAEIDLKEVGIDTGIVAACTISIYLLLKSFAQRRGRKTEIWISAQERQGEKSAELVKKNYARYAAEYCREWENERLERKQTQLLSEANLSFKDFRELYCACSKEELNEKFPDLTEFQRKTILKAKRIKRVRYDERYLLTSVQEKSRRDYSPSGGFTTGQLNVADNIRTVITTVLTSLFSASILQEVIFNPTKEAVIKLFVKLAVIFVFSALAMVKGYQFSTVKEVREMNAKSDNLEIFMKWCEAEKVKLPE